MANNSIGGFFVSLGMKVDQSFKAGEEALTKFLGTSTTAAAAIVALAKVAGSVETSNLKLAKSIGISTEELRAWQDSASKAGISSGSLTSSMAQLENKMQKLKLGEVDQNLAKNLGLLGIGYDQFAGMNATERMSRVFSAAQSMADQRKAAVLVGETLGSSAREYYDWLALSGRTLHQELETSKALNFETEDTMKAAAQFNAEFNGVMNTTKSIGLLISSKIGESLTPVMQKVQKILAANKEFIASGIVGVVDVIGKIGSTMGDALLNITGADSLADALVKIKNGIVSFAGPSIETSLNLLKDLKDILKSLWEGDWSKLGESLKQFLYDLANGFNSMLGLNNTSETSADLFNSGKENFKKGGLGGYLKGIWDYSKGGLKIMSGLDPLTNLKNDIWSSYEKEGLNASSPLSAYSAHLIKSIIIGAQAGLWDAEEKKSLSGPLKSLVDSVKVDNTPVELWDKTGGWKGMVSSANMPLLNQLGIQDGIVSPDGRVTQVAPDDWVIAARNLGDVASAFFPSSVAASAGNSAVYTITQEFVFNGHDRNMAQEVMRQAYRGTQSGLYEAMNRSTNRMQLMPGLR